MFLVDSINCKDISKKVLNTLSIEDHLLVVLIKLKLGLFNKDISFRFKITEVMVSRIYRQWLPILASSLKFLIIWPEKSAVKEHLPKCFRKYQACRCSIDCTERFIGRPFNLNARAQTWSNYKNHNTIKYLITCSPEGQFPFSLRDGVEGYLIRR